MSGPGVFGRLVPTRAHGWLVPAVVLVVARLFVHAPLADVLYVGVVVGASTAAWAGVRRAGPGDTSLRLIALGLSCSAAADVSWLVLSRAGRLTEVSVADAGYCAAYLFLAVALWRLLPPASTDPRARGDGLLDAVVAFTVTALLAWYGVVAAILGDSSRPVPTRLVLSAYPLLDALLVALVVALTLSRRSWAPLQVLLAVGVGLWLASDLGYALTDGEHLGGVLDAGWMLGSVLLGTAVCSARAIAAPDRYRQLNRYRIGLSLAALLVPPGIDALARARGDDAGHVPLVAAAVLLGLLGVRVSRLLSDQAALREEIRSRARYYAALAAHSSDAVVVLDATGRLTRDAPLLADLTGDLALTGAGADALGLAGQGEGEGEGEGQGQGENELRSAFGRALRSPGRVVTAELPPRVVGGQLTWLAVRLVNLLEDRDVRGVIATLSDISDRRQAEADLAHQAFHDGLTGLPNRALFDDRVTQALRRAARSGLDPAVLYVDLDGFKSVNDTLGHPAGDQVLREVADRLRWAVRTGDTVSRLGGDEFAILVEQGDRPGEDAVVVAGRVIEALGIPVVLGAELARISASVGIAVSDAEATAASLLRDADIAMYRAKQAGKSRYTVFDPAMRSAVVERIRLQNDLVDALAKGQFVLAYQPVVALDDERVVGFEALLRWAHPTLGLVPPDSFIPIAEESGLIEPIGRWVLGEAARTAADWQRANPLAAPISMAVNVSGRQISSGRLTDQVVAVLAETGLDPSSLVLEITETVLVEDPERAAECLQQLHARGVRLAIDDFGTGYSSLSYLRQFPVDILKIDRSFIASITDPHEVPAIVHGLVELGRTLSLEIIAEGVETELQRDRLGDERCDLAQGYLFSRPLPWAEAEQLLHTSV